MDYKFRLLVPANTTEADPVVELIDIGVGLLHTVEIGFPRRCAGQVHAKVFKGIGQMYPTNSDEDYAWDNHIYQIREHFKVGLSTAPFSIVGWNEDDTFPHAITFRFGVLPASVLEPYTPVNNLVAILRKVFKV